MYLGLKNYFLLSGTSCFKEGSCKRVATVLSIHSSYSNVNHILLCQSEFNHILLCRTEFNHPFMPVRVQSSFYAGQSSIVLLCRSEFNRTLPQRSQFNHILASHSSILYLPCQPKFNQIFHVSHSSIISFHADHS